MTSMQAQFRFSYNNEKAKEVLQTIGAVFHKEIVTGEIQLSVDEGNVYRIFHDANGQYRFNHHANTGLDLKLVRKIVLLPHTKDLCDMLFSDPRRVLHRVLRQYAWERSTILVVQYAELGNFIVIMPDDESEKKALFTAFGLTDADALKEGFVMMHKNFMDANEE